MKKIPHFLKVTDLSRELLGEALELAAELKAKRGKDDFKPLAGQTWALLFHKSSTRTRVSFEVGISELGGHAMILDQQRMQTGRGETVADTAKVLSRYIHGIIIRTFEHSFIEDFAREGTIPVVNALTDALHPCQIVSDLLSISERLAQPGDLLKSLEGRKLAFYGDCASNMAHSWILAGAMAGMEISLSGPAAYAPEPIVDRYLQEAGLLRNYTFTEDAVAAAKDADVLYTDVWVSMGDEAERDQRLAEMAPYQVNAELMAAAKPGAIFMHCLPAHEGEEVSAEVYHSPRSIVFDQAENRLHAQKAILSFLSEI
ncbi:MAG: ornithine carbamoyltransferase [Opitutales bacterium]|jgi:ornithine carbamoyltransferase